LFLKNKPPPIKQSKQHPLFEELKSQGEYNAAGLLHTDAQVGFLFFL